MRKYKIAAIALLALLINACKKAQNNNVLNTPAGMIIPLNMDTLLPPAVAVPGIGYVTFPQVNGLFVTCKISGILTDTAGSEHAYSRHWEAASFGDLQQNSASITTTLNGVSLMGSGYFYYHYDTSIVWSEPGMNHWAITGNDTVPSFSADVDGAYPSFTGTLPATLPKDSILSFTFNSSNLVNADSVYVVLLNTDISLNALDVSNVAAANGGTAIVHVKRPEMYGKGCATIPAAVPVPAGAPGYDSRFIMVVAYKHVVQTVGGKRFAFLKQSVTMGQVTYL